MMTDRARLRALLEKATPGPWGRKPDSGLPILIGGTVFGGAPTRDDSTDADAALIVAAVNALPELLDEVERRDGRWACPECGCIGHERLERERDGLREALRQFAEGRCTWGGNSVSRDCLEAGRPKPCRRCAALAAVDKEG